MEYRQEVTWISISAFMLSCSGLDQMVPNQQLSGSNTVFIMDKRTKSAAWTPLENTEGHGGRGRSRSMDAAQ